MQLTTQIKTVAATHWSTRSLAKVVRVSDTMLHRVLRQYELKPHIVRDFKVSRDSKSVEKLEDIVGLYMSPPEHALVLCCDLGTGAGTYAAWSAMKKGRAATKAARLQAQRHYYAIRSTQRVGWPCHLAMPAAKPPYRVAKIPQADRLRVTQGPGATLDRSKLRHAQTSGRAGVVDGTSTLSYPLHTHLGVLAEHSRSLLLRHNREPPAPWRVHQRPRS